jgi:DoxX-like family
MPNRIIRIAALTLLWIITILQALQFAAAGVSKFGAHSNWTRMFAHWGLPHWFQLVIGAEEVIAACLLLFPRTARIGAALIVRTGHGEFTHLLREVIPLTLAAIIFTARQIMVGGSTRGRTAAVAA